ncbi:MAG: hypothetical protein KAQ98_07920 [Bacteriovoracaceae bacterium]|nr:hypothetical protein [Bacteriovoracaceae bacterium]
MVNKKRKRKITGKLTCESSLQSFFFDQLQKINKKISSPISNEKIFYSSNVLNDFGSSHRFFDVNEGKISDKMLGIKLMESESMPKNKKKVILRDIGDTALFACGFFAESFNRKVFDVKYYHDIGKTAYSKLNVIIPEFYQVPSFFGSMALSFDKLTLLISVLSQISCGQEKFIKSHENVTYIISDKNKIKAS